jgi:Holliday junction resolvase-like predicted endonuclease
VNQHRLQNWIQVAPNHWLVARPATRPGYGFDVVEITPQARSTHYRACPRRAEAAALAATRLHNLTAEDPR